MAGTINGEAATRWPRSSRGTRHAYTEGLKLKVAVENTGIVVALVTVQPGRSASQIGG